MQKHGIQKKQFVNQYMAEKAGMNQVDKNKITEIIKNLTEGSPKYQYEQQMSHKRQIQLADMLRKTMQYSIEQKKEIKKSWNEDIFNIKNNRNLNKYWAHLDFDMFYVACEILDQPQLKDQPCAVGGQNSVICTANYHARKYGVRSALPTFIAKKLCNELILIPPDFTKYKKYSNIFRDILRKFDPQLQSMGLDQAYIQLTQQLKGKTIEEQSQFINKIRQEIFNKTGLTVSCGVGANKMLAKLASQQNKPNGQFILPNQQEQISKFMMNKKIRKIPGIGPVNEYFLKGLGIQTAADILTNIDVIAICFSSNSTEYYISRALGLGQTQHEFSQRKSLGKSETFKATDDCKYLEEKIVQICEEVCIELQELGYVSKNVVFTYQTEMFNKKDKTFQLSRYNSQKQQMLQKILPFLKGMYEVKKQKMRLLGIRCTQILKIQELRKIQLDKYLKTNEQLEQNKQSQKITKFFCPICNQDIDCKGNLASFNRHIDKCMIESSKQQREKLQEQNKLQAKEQSKSTKNINKRSTYNNHNQKKQLKNNNMTLFDFMNKKK